MRFMPIGVVWSVFVNRVQKDPGAVAARSFGVVESHIGAGKQGDGGFAGRGKGEADAQGDRDGAFGDGKIAHGVFHSFGDSQGIVTRGLREDEEELVASIASEKIVGAKAGGDDFDNPPEGRIACRMARGVVDLLEMIDVDERDGELVAVAFGADKLEGKALVDAAAIECAGYVVVQRLGFDNRHEFAAEHQHEEDAHDADEEKVDDERWGLEVADQIVGRAVKQGGNGAARPEQSVSGHQDREEVQDGPLSSLAEEFDDDKALDEEKHQGDDDNAGSNPIVRSTEVRQQEDSDSNRSPGNSGRPRTAKEEQNPAIKQNKRREEEEVHDNDRDEVWDPASHKNQGESKKAGEEAESERSCAGQMTVHPPHAKECNGVYGRQQSLAREERSIVYPHSVIGSIGAGYRSRRD